MPRRIGWVSPVALLNILPAIRTERAWNKFQWERFLSRTTTSLLNIHKNVHQRREGRGIKECGDGGINSDPLSCSESSREFFFPLPRFPSGSEGGRFNRIIGRSLVPNGSILHIPKGGSLMSSSRMGSFLPH